MRSSRSRCTCCPRAAPEGLSAFVARPRRRDYGRAPATVLRFERVRIGFPHPSEGGSMLVPLVSAFVFCFALERAFAGWTLPRVRTWPLRVILVNVVQLGVVLLAGISWERWLSYWSVFILLHQ